MKTFRVGVLYEVGGYITVRAASQELAEAAAVDMVLEAGEDMIKDVTHRDCESISDTEEV